MTTLQPTFSFFDLLNLMVRLRTDCPWDRKQTNDSLIPYAIEEVYELAEAIQSGNLEDIKRTHKFNKGYRMSKSMLKDEDAKEEELKQLEEE